MSFLTNKAAITPDQADTIRAPKSPQLDFASELAGDVYALKHVGRGIDWGFIEPARPATPRAINPNTPTPR
jgi:hypothetical protein